MKTKSFVVENTLHVPVKLALPNSYATIFIMPGVQTISISYCGEYEENPDKIFNQLIANNPFLNAISESDVKEVTESIELTQQLIFNMSDAEIDELAEEKQISFGRIKALDSKKWKVIQELGLDTPEETEEIK